MADVDCLQETTNGQALPSQVSWEALETRGVVTGQSKLYVNLPDELLETRTSHDVCVVF